MPSTEHFNLPSFKILLVFVCLALVGIILLPRLPVKLAPKKDLPSLSVSFSMNGQSSRVVEMQVTSKLEGMLSRIEGVEQVTSTSDNGSGNISIRLSKHARLDVVRFEVACVIRQLFPSLPHGVSYPTISAQLSDENSAGPFMVYVLNAPTTPAQIKQYAENGIKQALGSLKGIDRMDVYGATNRVWKLEYDYDQLKSVGLTTNDIQLAVQRSLDKLFLGMAMTETGKDSGKHWIRIAVASDKNGETFDASRIMVKNRFGKIIRLEELVNVSRGEANPSSYFRINGLNSVYLNIQAKDGVNQMKLASQIKRLFQQMETQLPANYEMHLSFDATEYIREQLNTLLFRSSLTILLLLGFVLLMYRNRRYVLMMLCSLAGSLVLAVVLYYAVSLEMHVYSLMGLTISLNLMLDNIIVMADQIHRQRNRKAFLAILASTLTTMAALSMIFFMDEKVRLNLQDFALIILINLASSLMVVLLLVPALMDKLSVVPLQTILSERKKRHRYRSNRRWAKIRSAYSVYIGWASRKKILVLSAGVLLFGLPVFILPSRIEKESSSLPAQCYNSTLGSPFYQDKMKPIVDVLLGGTLRLFVQKVYEGSYWKDNEETSIFVALTMPNGSTLEQTDFLVKRMEDYLKQFREIKQFQTSVDKMKASLDIRFTKENQYGSFPYSLKSELISKAIELGGGSWGVYGLGDGFSNNLAENAGSSRIKLLGYNYDELFAWANQVRDTLLQYRRIKEVNIDSRFSYFKDIYEEFVFDLRRSNLVEKNITPQALFSDLNLLYRQNTPIAYWDVGQGVEPILLSQKNARTFDFWWLNAFPGRIEGRQYRVADLANIGKYQAPQSIVRENQQYSLCLQYEYIGAYEQSSRVQDKVVEQFKTMLPVGYSIENDRSSGWGDEDHGKQYWALFIIICVIYLITSILFNSLLQPLAILLIVPISFVGLFLTFYIFDLNFDQGGFAAFVLLCGITVNAGIYVVNQYNQIRRNENRPPLRMYMRALKFRLIPVTLTVLATVLGFIPFLIGEKEGFWFPLAAGTIGGLLFSMIGMFFFLPVFMRLKGKR